MCSGLMVLGSGAWRERERGEGREREVKERKRKKEEQESRDNESQAGEREERRGEEEGKRVAILTDVNLKYCFSRFLQVPSIQNESQSDSSPETL